MNSPFYEAEQKRIYPYRTSVITANEIADEMNNLIEIDIETQESLSKMRLKDIRLKYFIQSDLECYSILEAFTIYNSKYLRIY